MFVDFEVLGGIISDTESNSFCKHLKNIKKLIVDYKNTIGDYKNTIGDYEAKVDDQTDNTKEEVCDNISADEQKTLEDTLENGENNDIHSIIKPDPLFLGKIKGPDPLLVGKIKGPDPLLVDKMMGPYPLALVQVKVQVDLIHDWLTKILATQFKYLVHLLKKIN